MYELETIFFDGDGLIYDHGFSEEYDGKVGEWEDYKECCKLFK